jgi:hypothetical protein
MKLRGGRRYYARLQARAETFVVDLQPSQWYDLWHEHFDSRGYSRWSRRARHQHLSALFAAFGRALRQVSEAARPAQVFVSIAPDSEAQQDALYVHTPNPNGTPFPHLFEGVDWNAGPPPFLRTFIEGEPWEIGALHVDGTTWWVVRARGEGSV